MPGSITRRGTLAATLFAALALFACQSAFAAEGDPYFDQCLTPAANGPCTAGTTLPSSMAVAIHPNQKWVYVPGPARSASRSTTAARMAR
jgi:hypothetical protein